MRCYGFEMLIIHLNVGSLRVLLVYHFVSECEKTVVSFEVNTCVTHMHVSKSSVFVSQPINCYIANETKYAQKHVN